MRVVQLNKLYAPYIGGVEQVVQMIAENLRETDMDVLVCNDKNISADDVVNGVRVHRSASFKMLSNLPCSIRYPGDVRKQLKSADVVISHMPSPFGDLALRVSGYKGPLVLWWHSDVVRQKKMMLFYKPLMKWILRRADAIIVATEGHIGGSAYLGKYREKCRVIPFAVDNGVYEDSCRYIGSKACRNARDNNTHSLKTIDDESKELSDGQESIRFLFVGRLVYYKGCDVLIKAFAQVVKNIEKSAVLRIVGDGPLRQELESLVQAFGISDRVSFVGKLDDGQLLHEYRNCDVLVLPSVARSEAFGLVQIEAMAYGKPVINTRLDSGVPYVGVDGVTGFTVTPGSADELAIAMSKLIEDGGLRKQMGTAARKRVEERYTIENMMAGIMDVIRSVL